MFSAKIQGKHLLRLLVKMYLLACTLQKGVTGRIVQLGDSVARKTFAVTPDFAEQQLRDLLKLYWKGQHYPLPFFQSSSYTFIEKQLDIRGMLLEQDDPKYKKRKNDLIKDFMEHDWQNLYDLGESYAVRLLYPDPEKIFDEKGSLYQEFANTAEIVYAGLFTEVKNPSTKKGAKK